MADSQNKLGTLGYSIITIVLLAIFVLPIPVIFLDFIIALNIVFSLLLILDVYFSKKNKDYSLFPTMLLVLTVFNLSINIIITRYIVTFGEEFDSILVNFIAAPLLDTNNVLLVIVSVIFILCLFYYLKEINKSVKYVSEKTASFTLDYILKKKEAINKNHLDGIITSEEAEKNRNEIQDEVDFFEDLNGVCRFIFGYEKIRLLFIFLNSAGGFFVGKHFRREMTSDAFEVYISLAASSGILSLLPAIFMAIAIKMVIKRYE